ncbi:MAG: flagellar biosynthesis anti-sigma factor FlgM [Acidobacteriaceae bacterium]
MRIDLTGSSASHVSGNLSSEQATAGSAAHSATASSGASEGAWTTLSSDATSLSSLVSKAMSSPSVRQGTVDSLRQAISSGQYSIDPPSIAAAMVSQNS